MEEFFPKKNLAKFRKYRGGHGTGSRPGSIGAKTKGAIRVQRWCGVSPGAMEDPIIENTLAIASEEKA
jgi:hypothetical protein